MLKINLLPPYIYEGKTRKMWVGAWILAVAAVVGAMVFYQTQLNAQAEEWKQKTAAITADADKADRLKQEADRINQESAGIRAKNDFVKNSMAHNATSYPTVYQNVTNYTINRVVLSSVSPSGGQVNVTGVAPSLVDVGHYVIAMEHNPSINNVSISTAVPGFTPQGPENVAGGGQGDGGPPPNWHPFTASLTLAQPIPGAPSYSAGGGGGGAPAPGVMPGVGGGGAAPAPGGKKLPGGGSA